MAKGKSIDDYRAKRDFHRTPEPAPGPSSPRSADLVFVIHRHDARRLHYDLRLEMDGVLRSWAVPKGFSWDPQAKHLAVRTEDHPMEYFDFHGVIPRGEYGAGMLEIWDRGSYRVLNADGPSGVAAGKLEIELRGRRVRGEWHMVKTKGQDSQDSWLLFKARDRYAWSGGPPVSGPDLAEARAAAFPRTRRPMQPGEDAAPFSDPAWLFEMEFVGERVQIVVHDGTLTLRGPRLPANVRERLSKGARGVRAEHALMDGMLVALDEGGRPSHHALRAALDENARAPLQLYVFDLLHYEEWDLRKVSLLDRKALLRSLLSEGCAILYVDHVPGNGLGLAAAAREAGLSGLLAKASRSPYVEGSSRHWKRVPLSNDQVPSGRSFEEALEQRASAQPVHARFAFTNPTKVYWPELGLTKGDLVAYYQQVADFILPHLRERPLHLRRCPDGIHGEFFYQRNAPEHLPDWIDTEVMATERDKEPNRHIICNHRDALLYLINLGSIDLHPWMSRRATPLQADWTILDLDPKGASFSDVIRVARALRKVLVAIGVKAWLKTSGKSGLHIYIPLAPGYTYEHGRVFCEGLARLVAKDLKDIATVDRVVGRRGGRVYIDFQQNHRGQTIVAPYVARPVPEATVSTPLDWEELDSDLHPTRFTLLNVPERLSLRGDLFQGVLDQGQDLLPAITALQDILRGG